MNRAAQRLASPRLAAVPADAFSSDWVYLHEETFCVHFNNMRGRRAGEDREARRPVRTYLGTPLRLARIERDLPAIPERPIGPDASVFPRRLDAAARARIFAAFVAAPTYDARRSILLGVTTRAIRHAGVFANSTAGLISWRLLQATMEKCAWCTGSAKPAMLCDAYIRDATAHWPAAWTRPALPPA